MARSLHPKPSGKRATVALGRELEQRLRSYAAAAKAITASWDTVTLAASVVGAAGVVMLGSLSSEAEVVYTPTHKELQRQNAGGTFLNLDLNNDGQSDFKLWLWRGSDFSSGRFAIYGWMSASGRTPSNQVVNSSKQRWDAALPFGAQIGSKGPFGGGQRMAYCAEFTSGGGSSGPWRGVNDRYLGLKFQVDGETHFGWARVSVTKGCFYTLTLTGYAYETVPNRQIRAGVVSATGVSKLEPMIPDPQQLQPATLGSLALGAPGLSIWRREEADSGVKNQ